MSVAIMRFILLISALAIAGSQGYEILGIVPYGLKSNYYIGYSIMKGLADAGHEVTIITPFRGAPIKHLREILLDGSFDQQLGPHTGALELKNKNLMDMLVMLYDFGAETTKFMLKHPKVVELMNSNEKFDLVISESFASDVFYGLGQHFNAPVAVYSSNGASKMTTDLIGTPTPMSHVPHVFLPFSDKMTFIEKVSNVCAFLLESVVSNMFFTPRQVLLYEEFFPNAKLSFEEMRRNVSLVLLNQHYTISTNRPYVPNMIEIAGVHIDAVKPLPPKIKEFLDTSPEGVIYFSMGAIIKGVDIPIEKRNAFIKVFSGLRQKVLWKYENDSMPNKPDNVMISPWLPQNDILAHPNVKVFITHGGLLGVTEAVHHGKALVGIPIHSDQYLNIARAELAGYGVKLDYNSISEQSIKAVLTEVLSNKDYQKNINDCSARFRDRPMKPIDTAVYWIEYLIGHGGAPHMHSAAVELSFFQYHLLDVYLFILIAIYSLFWASKFVLTQIVTVIFDTIKQYEHQNMLMEKETKKNH